MPWKRERAQQREPVLDHLVHPERLAGARAAHEAARLAQLVPGEEAERLAVAVEVAAERVHLLGAARDQLLHHRLVRRRELVRALELGGVLAAEELALVAAPEADVGRRLHDEREADLLAGSMRLVGRASGDSVRGIGTPAASAVSSWWRLLWTFSSTSQLGNGKR